MKWSDRSLRFYMLVAAAMLLAPLMLVGFITTAYYASSERQRLEAFAESSTEIMALAFDAEIALYRASLRALAVSPNIASLGVTELQDRAEILFAEHGTELSIISLPARRQTIESDEAASGNAAEIEQIQEDLLVEVRVSDSGLRSDVLIFETKFNDEVHGRNILRAKIPVERLSRYLKKIGPKANHSIHVYDFTGALIAGTAEETALSREVARQVVASEATRGHIRGTSADGSELVAFWQYLPRSQSHLVLSVEQQVLTEPLSQSLAILMAVSSLLVLTGTLGAAFLGHIMKVSQDRLLVAASAVGQGHRIEPFRTPLREINIIGQVLSDASVQLEGSAQALRAANERLEKRIQARTRELHQKSSLLKVTLDSVDQGIVHFNEQGKILLANRRCEELFSEHAEGFAPRSLAEIGPPAPHDRVSAVEDRSHGEQQENSGENCHPVVMERSLPGGTDLEIRKFTLTDGSTVCSFTDISSRVQHARELQRAKTAAEEANRAKDVFLANMSHELRTPLNAVLGYADLLMLDQSLTPANQERVRRMRGAGLGLMTVLNDLLDYSRIEAGTFPIDCVSFNILEVVSDAISIVQPSAADKKLALDVDIEVGLPSHLFGDPNRIRQVLINLLSNAVKFTEAGFVKLSIRGAISDDVATVALNISVEDSGIGIPLDQQEAVFERFHQVRRSNDALHRGTGLGLAICKQIVTRMGGRIWLRSSPEIGTIFTFALDLPICWEAAQASAAVAVKGRRPIHVLLADDVKFSLEVTEELLRATGVEVDCVADGAQAVEAANKRAYDLVILDINMPVMDGYEAARRIRANEMFGDVPIIACSATPEPADIDKFREASFDDYIAKPLDIRALDIMLRRSLNIDHIRQSDILDPPLEGESELCPVIALVGPARAKAGLNTLARQIDELIRIESSEHESVGRISEIAHSGLTSARLFGLEHLVDIFVQLESRSANDEEVLSLLSLLQPDLKRMLAVVVYLEEEIQDELAADVFSDPSGRAPTAAKLENV